MSIKVSKYTKPVAVVLFAAVLASCQTGEFNFPGQGLFGTNSQKPVTTTSLAHAAGEIIGNGRIRVALLLPLTAPGNAGKIGKQQKNAAKLAMQDFGQNTIQLVIKNTSGQAVDAQAAATQAIREGASVILGPLFSASVSAASAVSLPARVSMIAFSSDSKRARRGVYLMSFSPRADIRRTLNYAISRGKTRFVALLPNGAYGTLAERIMRETLASGGARIVATAKYDQTTDSIEEAARAVTISANDADAIYIPDGGQIPAAMISALRRAGVKTAEKMVLGSGQWESTNYSTQEVAGAYFAGRDKRQFVSFTTRYKAAYGSAPSSAAGLAYDAVSMAAGLARRHGRTAYDFANIESRNGYSGVNGIFRFGPGGEAQRGLAIYQIQGGKAQVVSQAPSTFSPGS